jgi:hypothetical protein
MMGSGSLPSKRGTPSIFQRSVNQLDLFPERVIVEAVDARAAAGERSKVKAIFVVQFERRPGKHQVFHDRMDGIAPTTGRCQQIDAARRRAPGEVASWPHPR